MYLNLVAIAALIAIASVMHKVPQIGATVPIKILISANLEHKLRESSKKICFIVNREGGNFN